MSESFFEGPWKVIPEKSLSEKKRLRPGEILKHKNGVVLLNCPACNSMQFGKTEVFGSDELPSTSTAIQCGSGFCKKCGVWFQVIDGKTSIVDEPKRKEIVLPDKLKNAGVKFIGKKK